jgi:hypothetical protein
MTTMDQEQQATTPRALWTLIVAGPAIVAIQMQANFILVRQACSAQRNVALYAVIIDCAGRDLTLEACGYRMAHGGDRSGEPHQVHYSVRDIE